MYNLAKIDAVSTGSNNAGHLRFYTNASGTQAEKMRIDSSGRVFIGATNPAAAANADDLCIGNNDGSGETGITLGSNTASSIRWADGGDNSAATIQFTHGSTNAFTFNIGSEHMRIDSSGKVGIGETTPLAELHIKPASNVKQLLLEQNNATDGYALFQDGPNGGHLKFMRHINGSDTQTLLLRSGGGLCFGTDSAAANALDDYEEGTWTPAISGVSYNDAQGHYVKIGTTCFVALTLNAANTSKSGDTRITGLPFTPKVDSGEYYPANSIPFFEVSSVSLSSGYNNIYGRIDDSQGNIQLLVTDGESHGILTAGSGTTLNSNHVLRTSFTYQTAA